jgi:hypothetical protein
MSMLGNSTVSLDMTYLIRVITIPSSWLTCNRIYAATCAQHQLKSRNPVSSLGLKRAPRTAGTCSSKYYRTCSFHGDPRQAVGYEVLSRWAMNHCCDKLNLNQVLGASERVYLAHLEMACRLFSQWHLGPEKSTCRRDSVL